MSEVKKIKRVLRVGRAEDPSLSAFVERPVPTEKEVAVFERVIKREVREQEVDSHLAEIYSDKNGVKINVQKMNVKKRPGFFKRLWRRLFVLALLAGAGYLLYGYGWGGTSDVNGLDFKIKAPEKVMAGEEFSYEIAYHNPTKYALSRLHLELQYPDSFIFTAAAPAPSSGNYGWDLPDLAPGESATLAVTGRLIAPPDAAGVIFGRLSYLPGSLTSQFKKEVSASTILSGPGFRADLDYSATAFVNQDNDMTLVIYDIQDNRLGDFNISFSLPAEASAAVVLPAGAASTTPVGATLGATSTTSAPATKKLSITKTGGASWQVSGLSQEMGRQEIPLTYRVKQKSDNLEIKVRLEKRLEDGQSYVFWEKSFRPELVTSDLNLTLLLNGSKNDGAMNSGQSLNYSLTYANHGLNTFQDVVIMASVSGDLPDWNSLVDANKGAVQNKTIIWTKKEIPALAAIKPGAEGALDFTLKLRPGQDGDIGKDRSIVTYGQYGINNQAAKNQDNKSNTITSRLNSDLSLTEAIRYFNDDNVPVGSGPLPPQVGSPTTFKVYWTVKNNLHELTDTRAVFTLPPYVTWNDNSATNVGNLNYDEATRQVIWEIGRLPVSVYRVDAEFGISITPADSDRNKILVLSPGSTVSALDTETKDTITKKIGSKTTKLEDDDIAGLNNSGVVQ
jgi:hypothetical protein